ncbi:hypothetical protein CC2G_006585 [Coprinopsis cinerea AmutBmut pab1-1]|nr:hypothetical protein CC2G_006585 [Coprinopsis cinerea AmutBmut pab1-1]
MAAQIVGFVLTAGVLLSSVSAARITSGPSRHPPSPGRSLALHSSSAASMACTRTPTL